MSYGWGIAISGTGQAIGTALSTYGANRSSAAQYRASEAGYKRQGALNLALSGQTAGYASLLARGSGMYVAQARAAADLGKANSRNLWKAAADLDKYEQFALAAARKAARARIGEGRASFAANGVLVDSGSAALWEQDEEADFALEQLDIMQQYEDKGWEYRTQADMALAEGYGAAAGNMAGAASAATQAYSAAGQAYAMALQGRDSYLSAIEAHAASKHKDKSGYWGAAIQGGAALAAAAFV